MKLNLIVIIITLIINNMTAQEKPTLIYFGDPMCSWCYGFSSELDKVIEDLNGLIDFEIIMGGLRPYNDKHISDMEDFLAGHWREVSERSGKVFNYEILKNKEFIYDTEPPSRAFVIFRESYPKLAYKFFKKIQYAFYSDNKTTDSATLYSALMDELGVKMKDFSEKFNEAKYKTMVKEDFAKASKLGVRGFPTVLLKIGKDYSLISNGYNDAKYIVEKVKNDIVK